MNARRLALSRTAKTLSKISCARLESRRLEARATRTQAVDRHAPDQARGDRSRRRYWSILANNRRDTQQGLGAWLTD